MVTDSKKNMKEMHLWQVANTKSNPKNRAQEELMKDNTDWTKKVDQMQIMRVRRKNHT